jgi:hypothetical protein
MERQLLFPEPLRPHDRETMYRIYKNTEEGIKYGDMRVSQFALDRFPGFAEHLYRHGWLLTPEPIKETHENVQND